MWVGADTSAERTLGGLDIFLPYIYDYVNIFTGKSIATDIWKEHLYAYFRAHGGDEKIKALDSVQWDVSFDHSCCIRTADGDARLGCTERARSCL